MNNLSHDDLAHNLAQHLQRDESRMVWENIPAGRAGSVRPDVYMLNKSFSNPNPITYEVKVSLSDFRSDVTKAKWKAYLDFSYGVVFAVPKGLVTKKDVPDGCGLIHFNDDGLWHTVKKPTLNPCVIESEFLLKLLMGDADRLTTPKPVANRDFNKWQHEEKLRSKYGKSIAKKISLIEEYPDMKKELEALKRELANALDIKGIDHWAFERNVKHAIDEIKLLACETERKAAIASELEQLNKTLSRQIDGIRDRYTA